MPRGTSRPTGLVQEVFYLYQLTVLRGQTSRLEPGTVPESPQNAVATTAQEPMDSSHWHFVGVKQNTKRHGGCIEPSVSATRLPTLSNPAPVPGTTARDGFYDGRGVTVELASGSD